MISINSITASNILPKVNVEESVCRKASRVTGAPCSRSAYHKRSLIIVSSSKKEEVAVVSRRTVLTVAPAAALAAVIGSIGMPLEASALVMAKPGTKVVVLGGTGFVGSRVVEALVARGAEVVSVSKSGKPAAIKGAEKVTWQAADVLTADLSKTFAGADAVISCIGVIGGTDEYMQKGNGAVNTAAAEQAKAANVPKFVYVSVASIVPAAVDGIALKGYFAGKRDAEAAVAANFPSGGVVIGPSFIYGGDSFVVSPPRVPAGYGGAIEGLLSNGLFRFLSSVGGPVGLTLAPPVSVEAVALSAVAAALGLVNGKVDGTDAINAAAKTLA
mmetsp:Transcript_39949/g.66996  ORF Transcript_39949/g.66996 Transcript_39949/m.66996 type:complete len:330 (-) Transcript_39949:72-1061(-)|eukprot:CAMPEP_0198205528 /NCGR_PEP_ID=MMETSP1445-20131203/9074_1 /TAXON_ID=36898 /ORGANISM="Pyramimonas sp., Strain CCMP2087" /LENGTH=329 /DNA_ID=CAMNT_0043877867 /DNA_START=69 /DNA_END=1058 /DNA_ORIENTATION=-